MVKMDYYNTIKFGDIMRFIAIVLLVFISTEIRADDAILHTSQLKAHYDMSYVYFLSSRKCSDSIARLFTDAIHRYSKKYGLNPKLIARQIYRESNYITASVSSKGALGACQITPFDVHDRMFRKTEKYNPSVPVREHYYWIYPSVEVMCKLMSDYASTYSYDGALVAYLYGENSTTMSNYLEKKFDIKKTDYWRCIFVEGYLEYKYFDFKVKGGENK